MDDRDVGELIGLPDDRNDSGGQADPSVYTLAAIFGPVALPDNMPNYLKDTILARAEQARNAAGDFVLDNRINPNDARSRRADADADEDDNLSQFAQLARQERQQREREEWSRTQSTVGGVTMTGAEWARFAERLRSDDELRRKLIETFERGGATKEEAGSRVERVAKAAEAASIPPGQRTQVQKDLLSDRQVVSDLETANGFAQRHTPESDLSRSFDAAANGSQAALQPEPSPIMATRPVTAAPSLGF